VFIGGLNGLKAGLWLDGEEVSGTGDQSDGGNGEKKFIHFS
jgi:hypothetical protein